MARYIEYDTASGHIISEIKADNPPEVSLGVSLLDIEDEAEIEARPFVSRIFFRTVETVMSLWDWLRGKIRESNNVVTFFCPIATEITLECKI